MSTPSKVLWGEGLPVGAELAYLRKTVRLVSESAPRDADVIPPFHIKLPP